MHVRFAVLLISAVASIAIASCGEGGNGVGTAPPLSEACPPSLPAATATCPVLQVCNYDTTGKLFANPQDCNVTNCVVARCSFAGDTWNIEQAGDAGGFADAIIPEVSIDSATDSADAPDASDAPDAPDAPDATDAEDATDSGEPTADSAIDDASSDG